MKNKIKSIIELFQIKQDMWKLKKTCRIWRTSYKKLINDLSEVKLISTKELTKDLING